MPSRHRLAPVVSDVAARERPEVRAGRRFAVAGAGLVVLVLVVGPLALLVHDRWSPLLRLDEATSRHAERLVEASPALLTAARLVTRLGDPLPVTVVSLVMVVALWARGRRRMALYVLAARVGALVLSQGLKAVVGRARPVFDAPVASAFGLSFPSGHALGGSAFWLSTAVLVLPLVPRARRAVLATAVAVALLIAASRVLLGVHYLSDVVAGLVLGIGWTCVCTSLFALWRSDERGRPTAYHRALVPEGDG